MKSEKLSLSIREIKAYTPDRLSGVLDNWRKFQYDTIMLAYGESVNRQIEVNDGILQGLAPLHNVKDCSDMNELLQLFTSELNYDSYNALADSLENNLKKTDEVAKRKVLEDATQKLEDQARIQKELLEEEVVKRKELEEATQKLENQDRNEKERLEAVVRNENERIANIGAPSTDTLNKLSELGELLKSGAISKDEFDGLKKEILQLKQDGSDSKKTNQAPQQKSVKPKQAAEGVKIVLTSFRDVDGNLIKAPDLNYINFKDINDEEVAMLKPFLKLKQINVPEEMTSDEIEIGNKLFSVSQINQMNSERGGFNYPFGSIISVLSAGMALFFVWVSPCMLLLGGGTGIGAACIISITTLMKSDATKLDRVFSQIALGLCALALFVAVTWGGEDDELTDCSNSKSEYRSGYKTGAAQKLMGSYTGCHKHVKDMNRVTYSNSLKATDCYCAGYSEALVGDSERY
jgi:hypothetical protein